MNKIILMGRLTRDPAIKYTSGDLTIARYSLAVPRRFKRPGEPEADFVDCVAFGKPGEFAQKYFCKGQQVAISGRLQIRDWQDSEGARRRSTEVIVEEQDFAEAKREAGGSGHQKPTTTAARPPEAGKGYYPVDMDILDDDLPFK